MIYHQALSGDPLGSPLELRPCLVHQCALNNGILLLWQLFAQASNLITGAYKLSVLMTTSITKDIISPCLTNPFFL